MTNRILSSTLRAFTAGSLFFSALQVEAASIQGAYPAVLFHERQNQYQYATFTLSTVNSGNGVLKISGNVRVFFGGWNSNEFLTYDFADVPLNILTRQLSFRDDKNDVSFIGTLGDGSIQGDWFSSQAGRVGKFVAAKGDRPPQAAEGSPVGTVTGHYGGQIQNLNPASNLPPNVTLSLVTTQTDGRTGLNVSGNLRFYLSNDPNEYVETKFNDVRFNFYTRYLTLKTENYGLTLKGTLSQDGVFVGDLYSDSLGRVGTVALKRTSP